LFKSSLKTAINNRKQAGTGEKKHGLLKGFVSDFCRPYTASARPLKRAKND